MNLSSLTASGGNRLPDGFTSFSDSLGRQIYSFFDSDPELAQFMHGNHKLGQKHVFKKAVYGVFASRSFRSLAVASSRKVDRRDNVQGPSDVVMATRGKKVLFASVCS